jgi:hypothetical protein
MTSKTNNHGHLMSYNTRWTKKLHVTKNKQPRSLHVVTDEICTFDVLPIKAYEAYESLKSLQSQPVKPSWALQHVHQYHHGPFGGSKLEYTKQKMTNVAFGNIP